MFKMVAVKQLVRHRKYCEMKHYIKKQHPVIMKYMLPSSCVMQIHEIIFFKENCHGQGLPITPRYEIIMFVW